jgi:hypothetical protein
MGRIEQLQDLVSKLVNIEPACFEGKGLFQKPGHEKLMRLSGAVHKQLSIADRFESLSDVARQLYVNAFQNIASLSSHTALLQDVHDVFSKDSQDEALAVLEQIKTLQEDAIKEMICSEEQTSASEPALRARL